MRINQNKVKREGIAPIPGIPPLCSSGVCSIPLAKSSIMIQATSLAYCDNSRGFSNKGISEMFVFFTKNPNKAKTCPNCR